MLSIGREALFVWVLLAVGLGHWARDGIGVDAVLFPRYPYYHSTSEIFDAFKELAADQDGSQRVRFDEVT